MSLSETIISPFIFDSQLEDNFLTDYCDGDLSFSQVMFEAFLETATDEINLLEKAISSTDYNSIAEIAHRVKANFAYVGLSKDGEDLGKIDSQAKSGQLHPDANQIIERIRSHIEIINKENNRLSVYLQSLS